MLHDPHPEIGGRTVSCTCHPAGLLAVPAAPAEHVGLTAQDAEALVDKEVG